MNASGAALEKTMVIEFVDPYEAFFLDKINAGLKLSGAALTINEKQFLILSMEVLKSQPELRHDARTLLTKCTTALEDVYSRDLASGDKELGEIWRKQNGSLYRSSNRVISCIVQHWYLVHGPRPTPRPRKSEVKLYTWYSQSAKEIWDDYLLPRKASEAPPRAST